MASTASGIDLSARPARPVLALVLALLSVPGSTLTWEALPGGGYVFGYPLAVAAIVLGVKARRRADSGRGKALAAILIGAAMVAMMTVWTIVESL
jgi:biotin transporter BioY